MRSSRFLLFTALFFATAIQAAPNDEPRVNDEASSPAAAPYQPMSESRPTDPGGEHGNRDGTAQNPRGGARYGTGYEARRGLATPRGRGR